MLDALFTVVHLFVSGKISGQIISRSCSGHNSFLLPFDQSMIVADISECNDLPSLFALPLSTDAYLQFQDMTQLVHLINVDHQHDIWDIRTMPKGYSTTAAYDLFVDHIDIPCTFMWIWNSCCQLKHKVFIWLLLINRLNTRAMLQQKNFFLPSYACILCQGAQSESRDHLFFRCPFSLTCWRYICPQFVPHMNVHQNIQALKEHLMVPFHMEITTLVCWSISNRPRVIPLLQEILRRRRWNRRVSSLL